MSSVKDAIKESVADQSGAGITKDHVSVQLSSGSVVVHATVTLPPNISAQSAKSTILGGSLPTAVVNKVSSVPYIGYIVSTDIVVSAPTVKSVFVPAGAPVVGSTGLTTTTSSTTGRPVSVYRAPMGDASQFSSGECCQDDMRRSRFRIAAATAHQAIALQMILGFCMVTAEFGAVLLPYV